MSTKNEFDIYRYDGYMMYSVILNRITAADNTIGTYVHDSPTSPISMSGLCGKFKAKDAIYHTVTTEQPYSMKIGVVDALENEIFNALMRPIIFPEDHATPTLKLYDDNFVDGELVITGCSSSGESLEDILRKSDKHDKLAGISMNFKTPACIKILNSEGYVMFPESAWVFNSLMHKWNKVCSSDQQITFNRDDISRYVFVHPINGTYRGCRPVIDTQKQLFSHGFMCDCDYCFASNIPTDIKKDIYALSIFAEYSGIGSAVSRGCGCVDVSYKVI